MAVTPWEGALPQLLAERFGSSITEFSTYLGQNFIVVEPAANLSRDRRRLRQKALIIW